MKSKWRLNMMVVSALGFIACSGQTASPSAYPTVQDPAIKQYQAVVGTDEERMVRFLQGECNPPASTGCPDQAALVIAELQQWLDDLNRTQPPTRFAIVDGQMRRHLALAISDLNALAAAYRGKDQNGMDTALAGAVSERDTMEREAIAVTSSSRGTITTYTAGVRLDESNLLACDFCQKLVSQNQLSCQTSQTPSCGTEIAATRLQVETFQDDLVRVFAPNALAAKDRQLKADLLTADMSLDAIASALSAADQVGLQTGYAALRQALGRADSDAAAIAKGV